MNSGVMDRFEDAVWSTATELFGDATRRFGGIAAEVQQLSEQYARGERQTPAGLYLPRLVFFTLADMPKVMFPLAELAARRQLPAPPLRVLDFGAGLGSQALGLLAFLQGQREHAAIELHAVDRDRRALEIMGLLLERLRADGCTGPVTYRPVTGSTASAIPDRGGYQLVLASNVINELPRAGRLSLVRELLDALLPGGHLVILEPALKTTARELHELRDRARELGVSVFSPCTRRGPCPMLETTRDWCHEHRQWTPTPQLGALMAATGLRRGHLRWSQLVLNRHAAGLAEEHETWRVVSMPLKSKGKREVFVCGAAGRLRAVRLDRARSADNVAFEALDRGRLVRFSGPVEQRAAALRITRGAVVEVEDPAAGVGYRLSEADG